MSSFTDGETVSFIVELHPELAQAVQDSADVHGILPADVIIACIGIAAEHPLEIDGQLWRTWAARALAESEKDG